MSPLFEVVCSTRGREVYAVEALDADEARAKVERGDYEPVMSETLDVDVERVTEERVTS